MASGTRVHRKIQEASLDRAEHKIPGRKKKRGRTKRSRRSFAEVSLDNTDALIDGATKPSCDALTLTMAISQGAKRAGGKMNLKNAVALITGGSSGIGRAIAQSLVTSGARVAITGRDERRLAEAARELGVHPIRANVAVEADVERTYREVF